MSNTFLDTKQEERQRIQQILEKHNDRFDYIDFTQLATQVVEGKPPKWKGRMVRVAPHYYPYCIYRYILQIPKYMWSADEKEFEALVYHELMHIPRDGKGLIQHDIQDFREVFEKFGFDWSKSTVSTNEEEDE